MGDKPGKYWDHRECRWVRYAAPADHVRAPAQPSRDEAADQAGVAPALTPVASGAEVDVRSE
jgi:hypothetical protein